MQQEPSASEKFAPHYFAIRVMLIAAFAFGTALTILDITHINKAHHSDTFLRHQITTDLILAAALTIGIGLIAWKYTRVIRALQRSLRSLRDRYLRLRDGGDCVVVGFHLSPDSIPGKFVEVNAFAIRRLGYSEEEFRSLTLRDIIDPERHGDLDVFLCDLVAQKVSKLETVMLAKDGRQIPIEMHASLTENGKTPSVIAVIRDISDPKRVEDSLREIRATFRAVNSTAPLGIVSLDTDGNVREWNKAAEELFGWREFEVFGHQLPMIAEENRGEFRDLCARVLQKEMLKDIPLRCQRNGGGILDIHFSAVPLLDNEGMVTGILTTMVDMTRWNEEEAEYHQAQRALLLFSEAKRAVFRATNEEEILHGICDTVVKIGGYDLAWVGFTEEDSLKTIRPVVWAGEDAGHVQELQLQCAEKVRGNDPITLAIRTGNASVVSHLLMARDKSPWLVSALNNGYGSLVVLPLLSGWHIFGILAVYSHQPNAFTAREVELLAEFADDLAYGVETMRMREERQSAEQALIDSARQWRTTFDAIAGPICVIDTDGTISRCNKAASLLFGKTVLDGIIGKPILELIHRSPETPEGCLLKAVSETGQAASEMICFNDRWYMVKVDPILDETGCYQGALHIMNDITEQKLADEESRRNYKRLQNISNETIATIAKMAEMRDPYTSGHEQRVSQLACAIGREMELPEERVEGIRVAGMLHDIGKLYVPAEMLSKSGKLTEAEFAVIKQHPQAGYEVLKSIDFPWPVAMMAQQHHERMDGTGYPHGLSGELILLEARILAVADVVESMASHRPYRPARGVDEALREIMDNAGPKYDVDVAKACVRVFLEREFNFE